MTPRRLLPTIRSGLLSIGLAAIAWTMLLASPAIAGTSPGAPLIASRYWSDFVDFWSDAFRKQNGIVMIVLGVGVVSILILMSGKKLK